jgi:hypothetical protein
VSPALQTSSPNIALNQHSHLSHTKELSEELQQTLATMRCRKCTLATLETLTDHVNAYIVGILLPQLPQPLEQKVQQRVIDIAPQSFYPILQRVSTPLVMALAKIPTAPRKLQTTKWTHKRKMQANTPGLLPHITRVNIIEPTPIFQSPQHSMTKRHCITNAHAARHNSNSSTKMQQPSTRLALLCLCNAQMISQQAIICLILNDLHHNLTHYTPFKLCPNMSPPINLEHYAMPMIHPVTKATISSYPKLTKDPATAEI